MPPLTTELLGEDHAAPQTPFQFLDVNGFVYRCNRVTGEMWRLGPHATDKKIQIWTLVQDTSGA
jgi:hypothetical protein